MEDLKQYYRYFDHTLLKPTASYDEIKVICEEGLKYGTASVCITPGSVRQAHLDFPGLNICTVIGFPLGYNTTEAKAYETEDALNNGASEIDMVINIAEFKSKNYQKVQNEIQQLKNVTGEKILKVIVETAYLDNAEIAEVTKIVSDTTADYIKTSTGFAPSGATRENIEIFKSNKRDSLKMKAAGGISTIDDIIDFVNLGCERLGTSSGIKIVNSAIANSTKSTN
jgi:deoxyribose-phosphate aldolase